MGSGQGACSKWWTLRTNLEKTLISLSLILFLTALIIILVGIGYHNKTLIQSQSSKLCTSPECIEMAGSMMGMTNFKVDPCVNFYDYACDGFRHTHVTPADSAEDSVRSTASDLVLLRLKNLLESKTDSTTVTSFRKAKTLYKTCMDSDQSSLSVSSSILKDALDKQGIEWPLLDLEWYKHHSVGLEHALAPLLLIGIPVAFRLDVVPDVNKKGSFILRISPGQPAAPAEDHIHNSVMRGYMSSLLLMLNTQEKKIEAEVDELVSVDVYFTKLKKWADQECGYRENDYTNELSTASFTLKELEELKLPQVNWTVLIGQLLPNHSLANFTVEVYCRRSIRNFTQHLSEMEQRSIYNYLTWRFLAHFAHHLGEPFYRLRSAYQGYIFGDSQVFPKARWRYCLSLLEDYMLPVLGAVFKENALPESLLEEKKIIVSDIRESLSNMVPSNKYLKGQMKGQLKSKIANTKFDVPLLKLSSNITKIDSWFAKLSFQYDHLMHNVMRIQRFLITKELRKLIAPHEEQLQWKGITLTSHDDGLKYKDNTIALHYAEVMPPYLKVGSSSYSNYAGFGSLISRYILHYLIDTSPAFNGEKFWNVFDSKIEQNSCFVEEAADAHPERTIANLIELGSLTAAYNALKKRGGGYNKIPGFDMSEDQMFFLSYAQAHCSIQNPFHHANFTDLVTRDRINFSLKNFKQFSEAYSCENNKPMSPEEKCQFWGS